MKTEEIVKLRIWFGFFIGCLLIGFLYLMFFDDAFMKELSEDFLASLVQFFHTNSSSRQIQTEYWFSFIRWLPQVAFCLFCSFMFASLFFCFHFTKEGFQCGFKFGTKLFCFPKHRVVAWCYEIIQVDGVIPFYSMQVIKNSPFKLQFLFCANFLNLIIFIDENVSCEKMDPDARENFRRLADKYRKLKKNHKILYWILNNV
ncbi:MAG: hypothetical protein J6W22_00035 [Fibrobacter sp.]|nr:hypothetical protein [Fibrobacter sp.]